MGSSPEPAVPAYRSVRVPGKRPQVLGADLNRGHAAVHVWNGVVGKLERLAVATTVTPAREG